MRTLLLVCLACSTLCSQPQQPPKTAPTAKTKSAEGAQGEKESGNRQEPADKRATAVVNNPAEAGPKKDTTQDKATEELQIDWWLAVFTGLLVAVGTVQFAALFWQGRTLRHHSHLLAESIKHMESAVIAYQGFARASEAMLALTRESNAITARATDLTRQSFLLSHRPKLAVRNVVVRVPQGNQDIASVAQRLSQGVIDSVPGGELYVVNDGDADGKIIRMHSEILDGERLPMAPPYEGKPGTSLDVNLAPGVQILVPFPSEPFIRQHSVERVAGGWEKFWVLGWIEYVDGTGNTRRTLFCRQWSNESSRFSAVGDADYERAD
jgi:hypothetical protein